MSILGYCLDNYISSTFILYLTSQELPSPQPSFPLKMITLTVSESENGIISSSEGGSEVWEVESSGAHILPCFGMGHGAGHPYVLP